MHENFGQDMMQHDLRHTMPVAPAEVVVVVAARRPLPVAPSEVVVVVAGPRRSRAFVPKEPAE